MPINQQKAFVVQASLKTLDTQWDYIYDLEFKLFQLTYIATTASRDSGVEASSSY